ncbi:MAG: hypothetical protein OEO77_01515 [Acidimicrobiia bacterium]|nr:hypothetical protein [Acidimicrobiia bacterium]
MTALVDRHPTGADVESKLDWQRPVGWSAVIAVATVGLVATLTTTMLAPPADPDAVWPLWGEIVSFVYTFALMAAVVGLGTRRRWGIAAAGVVGLAMVVASVGCFVEGHRAVWLWVQLAGGAATAGVAGGILKPPGMRS